MIIEVDGDSLAAAARIHSESWRDSHKSFCTREFIEQHTVEHQAEYLRFEISAGKKLYLLIESRPVGIVSVHENLIENLYVLPDAQGNGYGTELLQFAMRQCSGTPILWILENNQRAYALYFKHGFRETGKKNRLSETLSEIELERTARA